MRHTRAVLFVAAAVATNACWDDFPSEAPLQVIPQGFTGPTTLAVTDVDTIEVIFTADRRRLAGLELDWQSSDSSVLTVKELRAEQETTRRDSLARQQKAEITGVRSGSAEISATVNQAGFEPGEATLGITVVPLLIRAGNAWPDTMSVRDTALLELRMADAEDVPVAARRLVWQASENIALSVVDTLAAEVVALARGPAEIRVIMAEEEFEPDTFFYTIQVMERWIQVSAGDQHTCGLTVDSLAYCWGSNYYGELGDGTGLQRLIPQSVTTIGDFRFGELSAGLYHTCGRVLNQGVCWGWNTYGQLGNGSTSSSHLPVWVTSGYSFTSLSSGEFFTCATGRAPPQIHGDPEQEWVVVCWGWNNYGQLGYGGDPPWDEMRLHPDSNFVKGSCSSPDLFASSVSAGRFHTCGLWTEQLGSDNPGRVCCWGRNEYGQLGAGRYSERETLGVGLDLRGSALSFMSVTAGAAHTCALAAGGDAYCWGQNIYGQLGYGEFADSSAVPAPVEDGHTFVAIDAGLQHTCALEASGRAYCWGQNFFGQGGEPKSMRNRPTPVLTELTFLSISAGRNHTCGVSRPDGAIYCWGQNYSGQLGNGETNGFDEAIGVVRVAEPANR